MEHLIQVEKMSLQKRIHAKLFTINSIFIKYSLIHCDKFMFPKIYVGLQTTLNSEINLGKENKGGKFTHENIKTYNETMIIKKMGVIKRQTLDQ
jgi:hypothetical protein